MTTATTCPPQLNTDTNFALLPVIVLSSLSSGFGLRLRLQGKHEGDVSKVKRSLRYLAFSWILAILLVAFENPQNNATGQHYSTQALIVTWMIYFPLFLLARDRGLCCPSNARCWTCRRCCGAEDVCRALGNFGEYALVLLGTVGIPVAALLSCIACHSMEDELSHWVIMLGFLLEAGLMLLWSGPVRSKEPDGLQTIEGWMWFSFGVAFLIFFTLSSDGGLLYPLFHSGSTSQDWKQDQRHILISLLFIAVGLLSIMLTALGIKSGMPMALLFGTLFAAFQVQSAACDFAKSIQMATGFLCLLVGILRYAHKFLEASLAASLMAGTYMSASLCVASFGDNWFDSVAFSILLIVTWCGWWAFTAWQFRSFWYELTPETAEATGSSRFLGSRYAVVSEDELGEEDDDVEMLRDPFSGLQAKVWVPGHAIAASAAAAAAAASTTVDAPRAPASRPLASASDRDAWKLFAREQSQRGQGYTALHEFTAESHDELNLYAGERVALIQAIDDNWLVVVNSRGSVGLVPRNYVRADEEEEEEEAKGTDRDKEGKSIDDEAPLEENLLV